MDLSNSPMEEMPSETNRLSAQILLWAEKRHLGIEILVVLSISKVAQTYLIRKAFTQALSPNRPLGYVKVSQQTFNTSQPLLILFHPHIANDLDRTF